MDNLFSSEIRTEIGFGVPELSLLYSSVQIQIQNIKAMPWKNNKIMKNYSRVAPVTIPVYDISFEFRVFFGNCGSIGQIQLLDCHIDI